ncbi:hypothetical protein [Tardiphaga robiniae]|uniref:Uncharacterized protein n=1 Tax=Tardiphaga robiniae TaxID=943830 RepID=A0A7G6TUN7_9BRAD|nr:hypothetical protein [Tardiphaga robiniae]QND70469.1 hypothetical protein HB776_03830 [Tardiphaga robiniae]
MKNDMLGRGERGNDPLIDEIDWNSAAPSWTSLMTGLLGLGLIFVLCLGGLMMVLGQFFKEMHWTTALDLTISGVIALLILGCVFILFTKFRSRARVFADASGIDKSSRR